MTTNNTQTSVSFLKNKTFYLATVKNNTPVIRPFGAVMEYENKLYFVTANTKEVYKQIIQNPNVCICACGDNRQWMRINGVAKQDNRTVVKQKMLDDNPILIERKRYTSADDSTMAVFCLDNIVTEFN